MVIKRFEIWLINLDPTLGREIKKIRPCIILSHESINEYLDTLIVAPLTSTIKSYPMRVDCNFMKKQGQIALDHMRSIDRLRLVKKLGVMNSTVNKNVCNVLLEYFKY
ncbi:MAG: type II toxin-antitoxin system PemK/MazF family toxin [Saprospiraceae bacterium]